MDVTVDSSIESAAQFPSHKYGKLMVGSMVSYPTDISLDYHSDLILWFKFDKQRCHCQQSKRRFERFPRRVYFSTGYQHHSCWARHFFFAAIVKRLG